MKKQLLLFTSAVLSLVLATTLQAASGGPDSYGYIWKDSNEPNGPVFNWIEIATPLGGGGTYRSALNCDDCHEAGISLGFNFPFYGTSFNQISIGSNGVAYFENVYLGLSNVCMPGTPGYSMSQYNFIAHLWDDLAPNYQGGIYTQAFPNYFVIEYYNIMPCCAAGDGDTWQVILFKNGNILMQYKELSNQGLQTDLTVGIQNNPTTGLQYVCNSTGNALASGRAILFSPPTFTCPAVSQNILGTSAGFCTGSSTTLNAGGSSIAQVWSNSLTATSISVNVAGNYSIVRLDTNGCSVMDTITVAQNTLPVVNLGPDATACGGMLLNAGNVGMDYLWGNSATTQTIDVNATGAYSVIVTNTLTSCSTSAVINVTINPLPTVNLGSDIIQCAGTTTLDAGNAGMNYAWSNSATTQTITVSSTGTYSVLVTNPLTSCFNTDAINVTINPLPVVNLGADITQCAGTATLDAGNAGMNYAWSTSATTQTIVVGNTGTYSVLVTNPLTTCSNTDAINMTINSLPIVNLGSDIIQCAGTATLNAGNAGMNYAWSSSATTQTIVVSNTGTYSVLVTNPLTACSNTDAINVTINSLPVVNLGNDIVQCAGTATLNAGNAGMNYAWSISATTQTITVNSTGTYSVLVTNTLTSCSNTDIINVTINPLPVINLGGDIVQCAGTATLDAGNAGMNYLWSNSATAQTVIVSSTGTYSVVVINTLTSCFNADTINVTINPLPVVNLGSDIVQCAGTATLDAGNAGMSYLWSNSATTQTIIASVTGTYAVHVTNTLTGCSNLDTISVTINALPAVNLGSDIIQCAGSVTLDAGNVGTDYLWNNSATTQTIVVSTTGFYSSVVTNTMTNCSNQDSIHVTIHPLPAVSIVLTADTVCISDSELTLTGGSPAGGSFSGTGVSSGLFNPATAGAGSHTITYSYTDNNSCSNNATQLLAVDICLGLTQHLLDQINIYPNPVSGSLFINMTIPNVTIEVVNALGQVIFPRQYNESGTTELNLAGVPTGVYFVKISHANNQWIEKIIINH